MLHWNTVTSLLKDTLFKLMQAQELKDFRLVGGTALSLKLGHRMSVDIDLFTDAPYGSINFNEIETYLENNFGYVNGDFGGNPGMGKSYLIGNDVVEAAKIDLYYSMDPFFQDADLIENVRIATIEEIIAMKVDTIQRGGRKKDFWDLHELLEQYSVDKMITLHQQRFEWTHNETLIRKNFIDFSSADYDLDPVCLKNKQWEFIKDDFEEVIRKTC
jgi:predicted nucleotidyltransferase component of viral defense system